MTEPQGTEWYYVDTTKLTSAKDIVELITVLGIKIRPTYKNFDEVKKFLIIPEPPKTLDEIKQEFDEKIDELIARTSGKFECSKDFAEDRYNKKFDRIIENFEYAKDKGYFPPKLTLTCGTGLSAASYIEPHFVIKLGNKHEGYYTFGNGRYFKYYMPDKPNFVSRFFMDKLLAFKWIDEKNDQ
jgi:hypothetical protein